MSDDINRTGRIAHIEIPAPDLSRARKFYGEVFGWRVEEVSPTYCFFSCPGGGGAFDAELIASDGSGLRAYIEVGDIEDRLHAIESCGGAVIRGKTEIGGGHGHYAHFRDPNGNVLGLHSS